MTRRYPISLMILLTVTACGRKGARAADFDSATAAALAPPPGTPVTPPPAPVSRVASFDIGHALDSTRAIVGGTSRHFAPSDSVMVSVQLQYAKVGDAVSARLRTGNHTVDSAGATATAPDSSQMTMVAFRFGNLKGWAKGDYQLEVFLGTVSQGMKDFTVGQ